MAISYVVFIIMGSVFFIFCVGRCIVKRPSNTTNTPNVSKTATNI